LNRIRDLRIEKNISQADLAKLLNTTQQSISFYEIGKRDPDTRTLEFLSGYFSVSIDYLLCRSDTKNPDKIINDFNSLSEDSKKELEKYIQLLKMKDVQERNKDNISLTLD